MTRFDKENIARTQITQLIVEDPWTGDFYYQIYSTFKKQELAQKALLTQQTKGLTWQQAMLLQGVGSNGPVGIEDNISSKGKSRNSQRHGGNGNHRGILHGNWIANQMQAQMSKLIEQRKIRSKDNIRIKDNTLSLQGALGKIALNTVKNPRTVIQITKEKVHTQTISFPLQYISQPYFFTFEKMSGFNLIVKKKPRL